MPSATILLYDPRPERADLVLDCLRSSVDAPQVVLVGEPDALMKQSGEHAFSIALLDTSIITAAVDQKRLATRFDGTPIVLLADSSTIPPPAFPEAVTVTRDGENAYLALLPQLIRQTLALAAERTERQRLSRVVAGIESQLQALSGGSGNIVLMLEEDGQIRAVNPQLAALTGRSKADWRGKHLAELVHPDEQATLTALIDRAAAGESTNAHRFRLAMRHGDWLVAEINALPRTEPDAQSFVLVVARDVTRELEATQTLARERQRMATLLEAVPVAIAWVSPDLRYLAVNRRLAQLFNLEPEVYEGQPLGFEAPEAGQKLRAFVREIVSSPAGQGSLELSINVDDRERHLLVAGHTDRAEDEVVLMGLDITSLKETQASQQRQLRELALLQAIATAGAQATDEDELIALATQIIGDGFYTHNFGVLLLDQGQEALRVHPSYHLRQGPDLWRVPLDESIAGSVALSGRPLRLDDVAQAEVYFEGDSLTLSELCVPLKIGRRVIGVINAESPVRAGFTSGDERLLTTIAGQLAIAIERLRKEASERQRARQLTTIYDVARRISAILDTGELLFEVVRLLVKNMNLYNAAIAIVERDQVVFRAGHGGYSDEDGFVPGDTLEDDNPLFSPVLGEGRSLLIGDARELPGAQPYHRLPHVRAHLAVPLKRQDNVFGILAVSKTEPHAIDASDAAVLEILADQISSALQNAQLYEAQQRQAQELSGLYETALATSGVLDKEALFERLYQQVKQHLKPDVFLIAMYEPLKSELHVVKAMEEDQPIEEWQGLQLPLDEGGLTGWVMQQRDAFYFRDAQNETLPVKLQGVRRLTRTWLGIPLMVGRWLVGALSLQSFAVDAFSPGQRRFAASVARQFALALQNAQLYAQAQQRSRQLATLNELANTLNGLVEIGALAETVTEHLVEAFGYDLVSVYELLPENGQIRQLAAHSIVPGLGGRLGYTVSEDDDTIARAIRTGRALVSEDVSRTQLHARLPELPLRSALVLPMKLGERVLGALAAGSLAARTFDDSDRSLMQTVADQLAAAIDRASLFEETRRRASELELISEISATLRDTRTVKEVLAAVMTQAVRMVKGVHSELWLADPATDALVLRARYPDTGPLPERRHRLGEGITGTVAETGRLRVTRQLATDPLLDALDDERALYDQLDANVSLPVRAEEHVIGVLHVGLREQREFAKDELRLLEALADIAGSALYRAQVMETLEERVAWRTRELALANEQLKELDRLKSKFVSDISHELRTPMANLRLYADLLAKGRPEKKEHYLSVLQTETMRLIAVVEPILSYSQIGLNLLSAEAAPIQLNDIIETIVAGRQETARLRNLSIDLALAPELPRVSAEADALRQLFEHLLANALVYGNRGTIFISTAHESATGEVKLTVRDQGIGIAEEDLPHIFDWFYRGRRAGQSNIPGTGLGLAMVKATVDRYNGRIEVQSREGEGTLFSIWLPVYKEQVEAAT